MNLPTIELGSVARVFNGKTPSRKEQRRQGHPVLKIRDVDDYGEFRNSFESFVDVQFADSFPGKLVRPNDVLLLNAAHNADYVASKMFFARGSAVGALATGEWMIIRANPDRLDPVYLSFWLQTPLVRKRIHDTVRGIHLYPNDVEDLQLTLPSIREQQSIAQTLSKATHQLRGCRYTLNLCEELSASAFINIFGNPLKAPNEALVPFNEVLEVQPQNGLYAPAERYTSLDDERGTEVVHMSDLFGGIVKTGGLKRILLDQTEINKYGLHSDDILIARRSINYEGAAQPCRIPVMHQPLAFESSIIRVRPDTTRVLPTYLHYYLMNSAVRETRVRPYVTISTISGINQDGLSRIGVVVPPLVQQQRFARVIALQENLRATQLEALRQADHLFQTLLHQAFN
jgi:type I restriction enzyme S subunit